MKIEFTAKVKYNKQADKDVIDEYSAMSLLLTERCVDPSDVEKVTHFNEWLENQDKNTKIKVTFEVVY